MDFTFYRQLDKMDCGPTCIRMIAKHYGKHFTTQTLRERAKIDRQGVSMLGLSDAAESIGFRTLGARLTLDLLIQKAPLPCIVHWGDSHFVVLYRISTRGALGVGKRLLSRLYSGVKRPLISEENSSRSISELPSLESLAFHVADPARGTLVYTWKEFVENWIGSQSLDNHGRILLLEPTDDFFNVAGEKPAGLGFRRLFQSLWLHRRLLVQMTLGMFAGSALTTILPFLTQAVVDIGVNNQDLTFIRVILISQVFLLLSTTIIEFIKSWILLHISARLNLTVLHDFLSKLTKLPMSFFEVRQFGDIMQRIGDHHRIESFLTGHSLNILFSVLNLIVFGVILAFYHFPIFLITLLSSLCYFSWIVVFLKQRRKMDIGRFDISSKNQNKILQLVQGMQEIKLANAETLKMWDWERIQVTLFKWNVRSLSLSQTQQAGAFFINQCKTVIVTFIAAEAVIEGTLTLGAMVAVQYMIAQFSAPIEQMITFLQSWQDAQISLERLNEVHAHPDEVPTNMPVRTHWNEQYNLVCSDLTFAYPGYSEPVLKSLNLVIPYGKTTAIVGSSGSGKTTLLKLLLRFFDPTQGSILLQSEQGYDPNEADENHYSVNAGNGSTHNNVSMKYISHKAWRQKCGAVMQDGFIFSDTIARNIVVSEEAIDQNKMIFAARTANIHEFVDGLPLGYNTKIGAEGNGLSQGQKQRILIARAVYKDPQLLLFDEATNSLDASNESIIVHNLERFFRGRTVVVVAHRLSTVRHAHQIVVLEKGNIVEKGTHDELVGYKGKYFELVSNQLDLGA